MYVKLLLPNIQGVTKVYIIYIYTHAEMLKGSEKMFSIADNYNAYLRKESREWTRKTFSEEIFVSKQMRL